LILSGLSRDQAEAQVNQFVPKEAPQPVDTSQQDKAKAQEQRKAQATALKSEIAKLEGEYTFKQQAYYAAKKQAFGKSEYAKQEEAYNKVGMQLQVAKKKLQDLG
jgi:hypothetical protein